MIDTSLANAKNISTLIAKVFLDDVNINNIIDSDILDSTEVLPVTYLHV